MFTVVSWYLHASPKANESTFFAAIEEWLLERNHNYGFKFQKNSLKEMMTSMSTKVIEGERATLQIAKGVDESNSYIAISLDNESNNILWIVECVFKQSLDRTNGCFVVRLSKRINNHEQPGKFYRTTIPKLSEYLISLGVASKEKGDEYIGVLALDSQLYDLYNCLTNRGDGTYSPDVNNYPLVIVNESKVGEKGRKAILELQSLCHIYSAELDEKWAYKISYPRLRYEAEYYAYDMWKEVQNSEDNSSKSHHSFRSKKQIEEKPYIIKQELITLVNEGISHLTGMDYHIALDIINKNNTSMVYITQELASGLKEARKLRGFTQNELAEKSRMALTKDASTEEANDGVSQITGLLISRIETRRIQYVDSKKLLTLEKSLGLPTYALVDMTSKTESDVLTNSVSMTCTSSQSDGFAVNSSNENNGDNPKFCWHCGSKLPMLDNGMKAKFCTQCGKSVS